MLGAFVGLCAFAACGDEESAKTYDVILQQEGCQDVVLEIGAGKDIAVSALPKCQEKTGYTVEWDFENVQLTNVKSDILIKAKATPNEYIITYDAKGGVMSSTTQTVVYDGNYTLYQPTYEGHKFNAWMNGATAVAQTGVWKIADNVILKASWTQIECWTITFKQDGQADKTVKVEKGKALAQDKIPAIEAKTGYTVEWDLTGVDLSNIQNDLTVNAKETPNKYTVAYNAGDGTVASDSQEITFGGEYTLLTPTAPTGYVFVCWKDGETPVPQSGVWKTAKNLDLTAEYVEENANTYTITYKINGTAYGQPQTVVYGASYALITPEVAGFRFEKWQRNGQDFATNGVWNIDEDIVLEAVGQRYLTIKLVVSNDCCLISTKTVEVDWNATAITLPTPDCQYDEHTFKYWKLNDVKLEKLTDIWSRIEENATEITLTAYCRRNWTNNH